MRVLLGIVAIASIGTLVGCASPKPEQTAALLVGPTAPMSENAKAEALIAKSIETGKPLMTSEGRLLVCKNEQATTTRLRHRKVCLTKEEWEQRTQNAQEAFKEADRPGLPPTGLEPRPPGQ